MKKITVYSKPACPQCTAVKRWLSSREIPHEVLDISQDPSAFDFVTAQLGYKQAPVVTLTSPMPEGALDGIYSFSGFNPGELEKITEELGAPATAA